MSRVVAVVVTFQPERSRLARALERLRPQVAAIVVVDNFGHSQVVAKNVVQPGGRTGAVIQNRQGQRTEVFCPGAEIALVGEWINLKREPRNGEVRMELAVSR